MSDVEKSTDDQDDKKRSRSSTKAVLREAHDRFEAVYRADKDNKQAAVEDTKFVFVSGSQWPEKIIKARQEADEACLEFPQLKQFVKQVVNDQRQNRPGIRIHPAGSDASKEVAEILQGLIRGIEYESNAEAAYDGAFEQAVVGGRGYWRVGTKYERPDSFNQRITIDRIADASTVWLDPDYSEPDGADRNFAFVTEQVTKEEFEERWPKAKKLSWNPGDNSEHWYVDNEKVIVADYYRRVCTEDELLLLGDGSTVYASEAPPGVNAIQKRPTERYKVEWFKIAGGEQILEEYPWMGTIIPVVCCTGDEIIVEGKRHYYGLIRQARDAQRMYNYEQSAKVMRMALAPKAPWLAPIEAIAGFEGIWETANKLSHSYLPYNYKDPETGEPLPVPTRTPPAPVETGWIEAAAQAKEDIKSVIGMYQNNLGMPGQETSGRAILAREKQGDNATFHFVDNLSRAIALTGRIIVELVPYYYDTERMVTLVGIDDTRKQQVINQTVPTPDPLTGAITAIKHNDVTRGQYAVTVEAGPSYATKRAETQDFIQQLVQAYPPLMQVAGDLLVGAMDFPESDQVSERLKATLPPPVQQLIHAKEEGQDPQVAALQAQMQQIQQQAQQAMQGMQAQIMELKSGATVKVQAAQVDANVELQKARIQAATAIEVAEIQAKAKALLQAQTQAQEPQPVGPEPEDESKMMQAQMLQAIVGLTEQFQAMQTSMNAPQTMQLHYDDQGNPIAAVSDRHVTQFQYDQNGNPVAAVRSPIQANQ